MLDDERPPEMPTLSRELGDALDLYTNKLPQLTWIAVRGLVLLALGTGCVLIAGWIAARQGAAQPFDLVLSMGAATLLIWLLVGAWITAATFFAACRPVADAAEAYRLAFFHAAGLGWTALVAAVLMTGGWVAFAVPGLLFSVLFYFAPYVYVHEELSGLDAALRSAQYAWRRFGQVAARIGAVWLITTLAGLVPLLGPFLGILAGPYLILHGGLLYHNTRYSLPPLDYKPRPALKAAVVFFGLILPAAVLVWLWLAVAPKLAPWVDALKIYWNHLRTLFDLAATGNLPV